MFTLTPLSSNSLTRTLSPLAAAANIAASRGDAGVPAFGGSRWVSTPFLLQAISIPSSERARTNLQRPEFFVIMGLANALLPVLQTTSEFPVQIKCRQCGTE